MIYPDISNRSPVLDGEKHTFAIHKSSLQITSPRVSEHQEHFTFTGRNFGLFSNLT